MYRNGRIIVNRNSKELIHTNVNDLGGEKYSKDDWFECDEMIAPALVAFNKKGYETLYSCSGHIAKEDANFDDPNAPQYRVFSPNELYVTFRKTNPNKNLLKLLSSCEWDLLKDFTIEKHKSPTFLFTLRHEFSVWKPEDFINDTREVAKLYAEWIEVNQKFYALARKLPHKRQLNKSFRGKRMPYFKNMAANTRARHERHAQEAKMRENGGGNNNV